jgi:hypothetical protein
MSTAQPHTSVRPTHGLPTYEEPNVARLLVVPDSDAGFLVPDGASDRHIFLEAPGLVPGLPAVLYFRTKSTAGSRFGVQINNATEFHFVPPADGAQSWHEVVSPHVLRQGENELVLFVTDAQARVVFSDIAILYTSNKLTVTRPSVLDPG